MKIIFLDIDGVLNVIPQGWDKYGAEFHPHFVENLRHLIEKTGAKIVISSSWRLSGIKVMIDMWKDRDLPGEIIGITPNEVILVNKRDFEFYDEVFRGHEIKDWLDRNSEVENYVILDDDEDMLQEQMNNFVKTFGNKDHEDCVDLGYGLTKKCTEKAIKILNKKLKP